MSSVDSKRDEELLANHLAGDAGAFPALVGRYAEDLYAFFHRFIGNASLADDLVQETFLQVHLSSAAFDPARTFKPWLYTIAANKARDFMRARSRRPVQSLDGSVGGDDDAPTGASLVQADDGPVGADLERDEQRQRVRQVLDDLPEPQRLMLVLGYFQRLPYAEIAAVLNIPVGTVKSRLHAAVTLFAKYWLRHSPTDDRVSRAGGKL
jgi:RNA polymerase sigma-70 factor (ECF subfamily)